MCIRDRVLAGSRGLNKKIKRISVFDCPCNKNLVDRDIIAEGDVFITCLDQFKYETENIYEYLDTLIRTECSGLFVVTADMLYVLTEDILQTCDQSNFPVVLIPEDIPYEMCIRDRYRCTTDRRGPSDRINPRFRYIAL